MLIADTSTRGTVQWPLLSLLMGIVAVLSCEVAHAQDYEAVEKRLIKAVNKGELTLEQAAGMMATLRKHRSADGSEIAKAKRLPAEYSAQLKAAVKAGKLTESEAMAKWTQHLRAANLGHDVQGHYRRMGVDEPTFDRIVAALSDSGLNGDQLRQTLGGMHRVVHKLRAGSENFELNPRIRIYFREDVGLTAEQMELALGLARRIAHGLPDRSQADRDYGARVRAAIESWAATRKGGDELLELLLAHRTDELASEAGRMRAWEAIERQIDAAVRRNGSTEDANAKQRGDRREASSESQRDMDAWSALVKRRLRAALERHEQNREQASDESQQTER